MNATLATIKAEANAAHADFQKAQATWEATKSAADEKVMDGAFTKFMDAAKVAADAVKKSKRFVWV